MAQVSVTTDLEGNHMEIAVLTREDIHPLFKHIQFQSIRFADFKHSSLSTEQLNRSSLILYKEHDKIIVLKSKYN